MVHLHHGDRFSLVPWLYPWVGLCCSPYPNGKKTVHGGNKWGDPITTYPNWDDAPSSPPSWTALNWKKTPWKQRAWMVANLGEVWEKSILKWQPKHTKVKEKSVDFSAWNIYVITKILSYTWMVNKWIKMQKKFHENPHHSSIWHGMPLWFSPTSWKIPIEFSMRNTSTKCGVLPFHFWKRKKNVFLGTEGKGSKVYYFVCKGSR